MIDKCLLENDEMLQKRQVIGISSIKIGIVKTQSAIAKILHVYIMKNDTLASNIVNQHTTTINAFSCKKENGP